MIRGEGESSIWTTFRAQVLSSYSGKRWMKIELVLQRKLMLPATAGLLKIDDEVAVTRLLLMSSIEKLYTWLAVYYGTVNLSWQQGVSQDHLISAMAPVYYHESVPIFQVLSSKVPYKLKLIWKLCPFLVPSYYTGLFICIYYSRKQTGYIQSGWSPLTDNPLSSTESRL